MTQLSDNEVAVFANIFFNELWGMPALRNFITIIRYYEQGPDEFGDSGMAT